MVISKRQETVRLPLILLIGLFASLATGCTSILTPITGIPVAQVPDELLGIRRSEYIPVPVVMLTRPKAKHYVLDEGDILSVYIDGILPFSNANAVPTIPPVNFPDGGSTLPPSVGYPIPIQEDGLINLPLLKPFSAKGMTVKEVREEMTRRYQEEGFLRSDGTYPVVSLMRRRDHTVTVIRSNAGAAIGADGTAAGYTLSLPSTRNDVLNALIGSGGMPGFNERNEVIIYRTSQISPEHRDEIMAQLLVGGGQEGCYTCGPNIAGPLSDNFVYDDQLVEDRLVVRIPLRYPPGQPPQIRGSDITLETGDIVMVESRETELFYTGGLLTGGQFPLPRDYDLDVFGALAIAGQALTSQGRGGGGGGGGRLGGGFGGTAPTMLFIIRKLPCGRTYNIAVDLQQALNNSSQNILVQPGDTLILRYKPHEEVVNFLIPTFFTFGISELMGNRGR